MSQQLSFFEQTPAKLNVPDVIRRALDEGATLAVSISGGKDGQAMLSAIAPWFRSNGYTGQLFAIHADLGRAEWPQTPAFVEHLAQQAGVPLVVVRRKKGDLVARLEERLLKVRETATDGVVGPFWPSSSARYCTSHLKAEPINQALRNPTALSVSPFWPSSKERYCTSDLKRGPINTELRSFDVIISAEGVRGGESRERAKKPVVEIREAITASSKFSNLNLSGMTPNEALSNRQDSQRVALDWRPIFDWTVEQVWEGIGTSLADLKRRRALYILGEHEQALLGWPAHPAYVMGNERLSCALCVLGSKSDLLNGANQNPDLYGHFLDLEREGDATFKHKWSLSELPVSGRAKEIRDKFLSQQTPNEQKEVLRSR